MPLFSRAEPLLPLSVPSPDGAGWPDQRSVGRPTFAARTCYAVGTRHAFEPAAHAIADRLIEAVLPRLSTGVREEDEPYLRKVFVTAARLGAGLGAMERTMATPDLHSVDRGVAGGLWLARRGLPAMRTDWATLAAYFLLAGYYLARSPGALPVLLEQVPEPADG